MKHFESLNNDSIVTINDTDKCLYLKHKITLSGLNPQPRVSTTKYDINNPNLLYDVHHAPAGDIYYVSLHIPVLNRQDDEQYVYAMGANIPVRNIFLEEARDRTIYSPDGKWRNFLRILFEADSVENIRNIANAMEIYVYSDKIPTTNKYGMEIYDKDGNLTFNSNLLVMRLASIIYKTYPDTFLTKKEYEIGNIQFQGIKKPGLSFTYPLAAIGADKNYMYHNVEWNGGSVNITTTYRGSAGGVVRPESIKTTQVLICELDGTQDIPAIGPSAI